MPIQTIVISKNVKLNLDKDTITSILKSVNEGETIVSVGLKIIETFDGDKTFSCGTPADNALFFDTTDIDLSTTEKPYHFIQNYKISAKTTIGLYTSGTSTKGQAELIIIIN